MRGLAFAAVVAAATVLGACSAVDNFNDFKFDKDAGTAADLTPPLPGFGEPCPDGICAVGSTPLRPLMCVTMMGSVSVPGGICTRPCTTTIMTSCSDYQDAACTTVENMDWCLQRCDPSMGRGCRPGFACCANGAMTMNAGECAPAMTNLCH